MSENFVQPFLIKDLLSDTARYLIPMYQRNYAWGEGEINQLIQDVTDYQQKSSGNQPYYIGTLVVFERSDGCFEVIDGQQRFTTLSLIATCLKQSKLKNAATIDMTWFGIPNIDFESRPHSIATFAALFRGVDVHKLQGNGYNEGIVNGYKLIEKALQSLDGQLSDFCQYLFSKVQITRVKVPEDTDLNHYFEVMNSRGEQLEKHEVIKARLMAVLNDIADAEDRRVSIEVLNKVWEATANMERYVQYGFTTDERQRLFGYNDWSGFEPENFAELADRLQIKSEADNATSAMLLSDILASTDSGNGSTAADSDGAAERFTSVINFPNFLLHVLRLISKEDVPLDDKQLIDQFDIHLLRSKEKISRVKNFTFALLKCKYLFDQFVIKRDYAEGKDRWSLKRLRRYESGSASYLNAFDGGEDGLAGINRQVLMLLSAFHVSTPTLVYKHWLNGALYYLYQQDNISAEEYLAELERLAKLFVFGRFLSEGEGEDYFRMIYEPAMVEITEIVPDEKLRYGHVQNNFVFNFLDYLLWCKNKDTSGVVKHYEFTFRSSVEHFYLAQKKIDSLKLYAMLNLFAETKSWGEDEIKRHGEKMIEELVAFRDRI